MGLNIKCMEIGKSIKEIVDDSTVYIDNCIRDNWEDLADDVWSPVLSVVFETIRNPVRDSTISVWR